MEDEELIEGRITRTLERIKRTNEMIQLQYEIEEGDFFDRGAVIQYEEIKSDMLKELQNLLNSYGLRVEDIYKVKS